MDALAPIARTVDPDALTQLVETWMDNEAESASVSFEYCRCHVTVHGRGEVGVFECDRAESNEVRAYPDTHSDTNQKRGR